MKTLAFLTIVLLSSCVHIDVKVSEYKKRPQYCYKEFCGHIDNIRSTKGMTAIVLPTDVLYYVPAHLVEPEYQSNDH